MLARYLRPQASRLATLAVFLIASIATQLVSPLIVRRFIDTAAKGGAHVALTVLWLLAGAFIAAAIVDPALADRRDLFLRAAGLGGDQPPAPRPRHAHCLYLDMSFHTATSPGDIIERVDGDVAALANFFSQFVLQILGGALLLVGILAVLTRRRTGASARRWASVAIVAGVVMHAMRDLAARPVGAGPQRLLRPSRPSWRSGSPAWTTSAPTAAAPT